MSKLYLAGPISGLTFGEASAWREDEGFKQRLAQLGWEPVSPFNGFKAPEDTHLDAWFEGDEFSARAATINDLKLIDECHAVLLNLSAPQDRVSVGSMCELGYAHKSGKPVVTVRPYQDASVYNHPFIEELSTYIVPSLPEAYVELGVLGNVLRKAPYA